ncbi:MAG: hypothetical protein ACI9CO_000101 [Candidatus Azotimanducaceae bacterium]|jgi:hypothetical protein
MTANLMERGITQCAVIKANSLSANIAKEIPECRAEPKAREKPITDERLIIILSQDCDIYKPISSEKNLEVLVASKAKARDAGEERLAKARNPRRLVIEHDGKHWLCDASFISIIPKKLLIDDDGWAVSSNLDSRQSDIILQWRINRYTRKPLPDKFNQAFIIEHLQNPDTNLQRFLERNHNQITDLFAYVWPQEEAAEKYWVSLTTLLAEQCSPDFKENIEATLQDHIDLLHSANNSLHMLQCEWEEHGNANIPTQEIAALPEDFSMADANAMKRLTLDYLCWPDPEEDADD